MEQAGMDYIIQTVFKTNILPVISKCNTRCIFCSHKQNPEELQVYRLPPLTLEHFEEIINFLSPHKKITVGEAATRIIEGEPFLHKDLLKILRKIRTKYPKTPIQVTTNGLLLTDKAVQTLVDLGNIELNISINSVHPMKHKQLLGLKKETDIREKLLLIKGRLKYTGSCVFVPGIMLKEDLEAMCSFLQDHGGEALKIFIPGYTKWSDNQADFGALHQQIKGYVDEIRTKYTLPMVLEPPQLNDLKCEVEGLIKGSPGAEAGILVGDCIVEVNGQEVFSRVDGFNRIFRAFNPTLLISRGNQRLEIKLKKQKNTSSGLIMLYDIDPELPHQIQKAVKRNDGSNVLFITSELGFPILEEAFKKSDFPFSYGIIPAENQFFGGTIQCGGLLTVEDIIKVIRRYLDGKESPDLILLPPNMFDSNGKDLLGRSIKEIEREFNIKTEIP